MCLRPTSFWKEGISSSMEKGAKITGDEETTMDNILIRLTDLMRDVTGGEDPDDDRRISSIVRLAEAELTAVDEPSEEEMIDALLGVMRDDPSPSLAADIVVTDPNDFGSDERRVVKE